MRGWFFVLLLVALYWPSAAIAEDSASPLTAAVAGLSDPDDAVKSKSLDSLLAAYDSLDGTRLYLRSFFLRDDNPQLRSKALLLLSHLEQDFSCSDLLYAVHGPLKITEAGEAFQTYASRKGCFDTSGGRTTTISTAYERFRRDLRDPSPLIRADAIKALTRIALDEHGGTAKSREIIKKHVGHILRERLKDSDLYVQTTALISLTTLGAPLVVCEEVQALDARVRTAPATVMESRARQMAVVTAERDCAKVVPERRHGGP